MEEPEKTEAARPAKPDSNLKCCAFCKHYVPGSRGYWNSRGVYTWNSPPTCEKNRYYIDYARVACECARREKQYCGPEARFFEPEAPKKGFWKTLWEYLTLSPLDPIVELAERAKHDH